MNAPVVFMSRALYEVPSPDGWKRYEVAGIRYWVDGIEVTVAEARAAAEVASIMRASG